MSSPKLVFDIETNGLFKETTVVHCISTYDLKTGKARHFDLAQIESGLEYLSRAELLCGHNICGFDFKVLKKLYNWSPTEESEMLNS